MIAVEEMRLFEVAEPRDVRISKNRSRRQQFLNPPVQPTTLMAIWDLYVSTMHSGRGRPPQLTPERAELITMAVNQYDVDTVKDAIRGCALSSWHMGQNPTGRRYTSIELILRDSEHIERFQGLTVAEETRGGFLDD